MTTPTDISPEAVESACAFIERVSPDVLGAQVVHIIRALRTELTKAHKTNDGLSAEYVKTRLNLQDAEFALTASGEALREYGHHKNSCRFVSNVPNPGIRPGSCTCGLEAAREKANG